MGILKNITDEYFDKIKRNEEKIISNIGSMRFLDLGGSVLWSDRNLVIENHPKRDLKYKEKFLFKEICDIKFDKKLRIPTVEEFRELNNVEKTIYRETKTSVPDIVFIKDGDWDNSLWFNVRAGITPECKLFTSDENGEYVNVVCLDFLLYDKNKPISINPYYKDLYFEVRLVKDK